MSKWKRSDYSRLSMLIPPTASSSYLTRRNMCGHQYQEGPEKNTVMDREKASSANHSPYCTMLTTRKSVKEQET